MGGTRVLRRDGDGDGLVVGEARGLNADDLVGGRTERQTDGDRRVGADGNHGASRLNDVQPRIVGGKDKHLRATRAFATEDYVAMRKPIRAVEACPTRSSVVCSVHRTVG